MLKLQKENSRENGVNVGEQKGLWLDLERVAFLYLFIFFRTIGTRGVREHVVNSGVGAGARESTHNSARFGFY